MISHPSIESEKPTAGFRDAPLPEDVASEDFDFDFDDDFEEEFEDEWD